MYLTRNRGKNKVEQVTLVLFKLKFAHYLKISGSTLSENKPLLFYFFSTDLEVPTDLKGPLNPFIQPVHHSIQ